MPNRNVNVYIDCENIKVSSRRISNKRVHYPALMGFLYEKYVNTVKNYHTTLTVKAFVAIDDREDYADSFVDTLEGLGIRVIKTEKYMAFPDESSRGKENTDLYIAAEIQKDLMKGDIHNFVLISGDRDFAFLGKRIMQKDKTFEVIGPKDCTYGEYKKMKSFTYLSNIPFIFVDLKVYEK